MIQTKKGEKAKCEIALYDQSLSIATMNHQTEIQTIPMTLWGDLTSVTQQWMSERTVLLMENVTAKEFRGRMTICFGRTSSMIVNPELQAAASLYSWSVNRPQTHQLKTYSTNNASSVVDVKDIVDNFCIIDLHRIVMSLQEHDVRFGFVFCSIAMINHFMDCKIKTKCEP